MATSVYFYSGLFEYAGETILFRHVLVPAGNIAEACRKAENDIRDYANTLGWGLKGTTHITALNRH